jgi:hypothetical protein
MLHADSQSAVGYNLKPHSAQNFPPVALAPHSLQNLATSTGSLTTKGSCAVVGAGAGVGLGARASSSAYEYFRKLS